MYSHQVQAGPCGAWGKGGTGRWWGAEIPFSGRKLPQANGRRQTGRQEGRPAPECTSTRSSWGGGAPARRGDCPAGHGDAVMATGQGMTPPPACLSCILSPCCSVACLHRPAPQAWAPPLMGSQDSRQTTMSE